MQIRAERDPVEFDKRRIAASRPEATSAPGTQQRDEIDILRARQTFYLTGPLGIEMRLLSNCNHTGMFAEKPSDRVPTV